MIRDSFIVQNVEELIKSCGRIEVDQPLKERVLRLLRPLSSAQRLESLTPIVKQKLRVSIIENSSKKGQGSVSVSKFEKECENLQRLNPALLGSFLTFVEPLSFPTAASLFDHKTCITNNSILDLPSSSSLQSVRTSAHLSHPQKNEIESQLNNKMPPKDADLAWVSEEVELMLIKDLLYVFQGINGKHITYDSRSESYSVDPSLGIFPPVRDVVLALCELGWLYLRVEKYTKAVDESSSSRGLVVQACGFALQEELQDYYRLLVVLDQELHRRASLLTGGISDASTSSSDGRDRGDSSTLLKGYIRGGLKVGDAMEVGEGAGTGGTSGLTLLRLRAWMYEPIDRMYLLASIADAAGATFGGALASRVSMHMKHGDEKIRLVVARLMDSVCAPIYSILVRWILRGDLDDPHSEFFVGMNSRAITGHLTGAAVAQGRNMWRDTYFLRLKMLPSFFTKEMAERVLVIGKSINFIRACKEKLPTTSYSSSAAAAVEKERDRDLRKIRVKMVAPSVASALGFKSSDGFGDPYFVERDNEIFGSITDDMRGRDGKVDDYARGGSGIRDGDGYRILPETEAELRSLTFGDESRLATIMVRISTEIDSRLLHLMMRDFTLEEHLLALKKFMLLGQGDFVTCLMDAVGPELQKPPSKLYRHNLTGILDGALRASNAQYEPSYVLNRVVVRLLEGQDGDSGWEIFSLDYAVDAPLNAVVHRDALGKYRTAFQMLWRLKRVEWSLSSSWKQLMTLAWRGYGRNGRGNWRHEFPKLLPVLHRCALSRASMTHVVHNLCAFLMFEVMESSWAGLLTGLSRARSLDDVIAAHDAYLSEILGRSLLGQRHEALNLQVQRVLQCILRFCSLESSLITDATVAMAKRRRQTSSSDHLDDARSVDALASYDGVPAYIVTRVDEAMRDYAAQLQALTSMLKKEQASGRAADSHTQGQIGVQQQTDAGSQDIIRYLVFRLEFNNEDRGQGQVGVKTAQLYGSQLFGGYIDHAGGVTGSGVSLSTYGVELTATQASAAATPAPSRLSVGTTGTAISSGAIPQSRSSRR